MDVKSIGAAPAPEIKPRYDKAKVHEAAQQFEALMIQQMLKGVRDSGTSWLGTDADSTSESAVEMAEQEFSKALSLQGGLGMARMVEAGLGDSAAGTAAPTAPAKQEGDLLRRSSS